MEHINALFQLVSIFLSIYVTLHIITFSQASKNTGKFQSPKYKSFCLSLFILLQYHKSCIQKLFCTNNGSQFLSKPKIALILVSGQN
ncbi:MAG: hypothetical protein WCG25_02890 [bacterium]